MSLYTSISLRLLRKLETLQRRSVRLLYCLRRDNHGYVHTSITLLMTNLEWLPARKLAKYKLLCLAHKFIYTGEPEYLADLLNPFSTRTQRSANRYKMHGVHCTPRQLTLPLVFWLSRCPTLTIRTVCHFILDHARI